MASQKQPNIVITGVSSGIGNAFIANTNHPIYHKFQIVGLGRTNAQSADNIPNYQFIKVDLTDSDQVNMVVKDILEKHGRIDILVNNAGVGFRGAIEELPIAQIKEQFELNVFAAIYLIQQVLPAMRNQKSGHIINISSVGGVISTPTLGYYAASKAALDKITDVLAQEVEKYNIHVSRLLPGAVKSSFGKNMQGVKDFEKSPYKWLYEEWVERFKNFFEGRNTADEAAQAIWNLIENPKSEYTMTTRDKLLCWSKRVLPNEIHKNMFLKRYFYYET